MAAHRRDHEDRRARYPSGGYGRRGDLADPVDPPAADREADALTGLDPVGDLAERRVNRRRDVLELRRIDPIADERPARQVGMAKQREWV